ncbi:MAG: PAS domain S-box protein [Proteobacteria bacterium]|nr:PAS domain S-box protein [Pseudomonadota bacterium]
MDVPDINTDNQIKILIVDDDLPLLSVYAKILARSGYGVETASTGRSAVEKLTSFFPDIVLLDICLPDMSGHEILALIRSTPRFCKMFVIMITGYEATATHKAMGLESGADDYLGKPVTVEVLLARIKAMVRITHSERKLQRANKLLEDTVRERTLALCQSNASLKEEIEKHEKTLVSLRESEKWLKRMFEQAPIAAAVIGPEGRFKKINREMCRMTGYRETEILSLCLADITHPEDRVQDQEITANLLQGKIDHYQGEKRYVRKNGTIFWGKVTVRLIRNPDGSAYLLPMIINIDQRKKAQADLEKAHATLEQRITERTCQLQVANQELRTEILERKRAQIDSQRKEKHLRTSQKIATLASFFMAPDGNALDCSDGFYRLFGYQPGEIILGYPFIEKHIFSKDQDRFVRDVKRYIKTHDSFDNEYKIVTQKGPIRDIRLIVTTVFDADGKPFEIQGIFQDITEKKRMERQVIQNEKLASLGFMASGLAHEINNPNNLISFNIPILREYLFSLLPITDVFANGQTGLELCDMKYGDFKRDLFRLLDNIESGSVRINKIVYSFRKFVQIKSDTEYQHVDIAKLIQGCVEISSPKMKKLVRHFQVTIDENLPEMATDPEILEMAVTNLLINAAQACDKPESIVSLSVSYEDHLKRQLVIRVSDNGCGMDKDTVSRAFDPFFSTKASEQGTGIGLSLCHNMISSQGGRIEVESTPGQGSTFCMILPDIRERY